MLSLTISCASRVKAIKQTVYIDLNSVSTNLLRTGSKERFVKEPNITGVMLCLLERKCSGWKVKGSTSGNISAEANVSSRSVFEIIRALTPLDLPDMFAEGGWDVGES